MAYDKHETKKEIPLSWFGKTLWKFTPLYIELIFLAICLRLIGLVEPFIFQVIIDRVLPFQREATLIVVVSIFAAASLFQIGFSVLSSVLNMITANRITQELGSRIFDHLFKLPLSHFRRWPVGETLARIGETDTIRAFLIGTSIGTFLDLIFIVVYIVVLLSLSPLLTLIVLASLPVQAAIYLGFGPFLRKRLRVQFDTGAHHQSQMVENISGAAAVKALGAERKMLAKLDSTLHASIEASYRVGLLQLVSSNLIFIVERSLTIGIIFFGASLVFAGKMTLGELIAFHLLSGKVIAPISNFAGLWEDWQNIKISRQRLGDIINVPQEPFDNLPKLPLNIIGNLEFNDISFSYVEGYPIIQDFNFSAKENSLNIIIGESGAGKSTFGRLAAGIEVPSSGIVTLNGEDISLYDPHDVRMKIAYVPQEPYLFSGTIRDNLLLGVENATEDELQIALKIAAADKMVQQLPQGIDTFVGERGGSLSGGQRQRIATARSILLKPKVLILDEPTSALDENAQVKMSKELKKLKKNTTIIIITHRQDAFESVDQVVEFKGIINE